MLLYPKKTKYQTAFTGSKILTSKYKEQNLLKFAKHCMVSKSAGFISNFQIEAIRLFLRRLLKKKAQLFFRVYPNQPITKKPNQMRLGRGIGNFKYWACYVKAGKIIIEINGNNNKSIILALLAIKYKLAIKTSIHSIIQR